MAVKRISAATLLEAALVALREDIAPALEGEKREAAAQIANAIEIACRDIATETEVPLWALLDDIYEPGEGTARELAADIRAGTVDEAKHPRLASMLLAHLAAELAIANPGFLKQAG